MCGVSGIFSTRVVDQGALQRMSDALTHRGPDDSGLWVAQGMGLAHRRLSIVDLSAAGHQPMHSRDGRFVLSYNGEIYNAPQLRAGLAGEFRGHSDTEVLLELIAQDGVEIALTKTTGMFALACFDTQRRELWLARDRLGEKPMYAGYVNNDFVFVSEIEALRRAYGSELRLDTEAVAGYLRHNYLPGDRSIYAGIRKVLPGQLWCLTEAQLARQSAPQQRSYWDFPLVNESYLGSEEDAVADLKRLLRASVGGMMAADVPVGAFLSGGIDSSLVCAVMQEHARQPIRTFTMGFAQDAYDETEHAAKVAKHLGTDHTQLEVTHDELLQTVADLPNLVAEPFADSSFLPTLLIAKHARQHVTVALTGDGGDELFCGYTRYSLQARLAGLRRWIPSGVRAPLAGISTRLARSGFAQRRVIGRRNRSVGRYLTTLGELLACENEQALYLRLISHVGDPSRFVQCDTEPVTPYNAIGHWTEGVAGWRRCAVQDALAYLPNDILTKVDRASMAVSLETRIPLLDPQLVQFACSLPQPLLNNRQHGKWLLRRVLGTYMPTELFERPKQGFAVPLDAWLRGPLRDWLLQTLSEATLRELPWLNHMPIIEMRDQHLSGQADWGAQLWDHGVLVSWLNR